MASDTFAEDNVAQWLFDPSYTTIELYQSTYSILRLLERCDMLANLGAYFVCTRLKTRSVLLVLLT